MVFVAEDMIVIFREIKTILILISFKRYSSHPEKTILNLGLPIPQGGIVIPDCWLHYNNWLSQKRLN